MTSLLSRTLLAGACVAASLAMAPALAAGPAPEATTATNPLGGKSNSGAKPAAGAKQITWMELVPPGWDPSKDFKDIDLGKLEDNDPRAAELLQKMQDVLNNAPTNAALNGVQVRLPGFVVPLEESKGLVSEFLLVPYFGACIHTPPPPANQILHVRPRTPVKFRAMDAVWVSGPLRTERNDSMMGASGYSMTAEAVTKYTENGK